MIPKLSLIHLLLQGIPEAMAMVAVVLAFANLELKLNWRIIVVVGIVQGITAYLIRLMPISFGIHTIILIISLAVYVKMATGLSIVKVLKDSAISMVLVAVVEILVDLILLNLLKISFTDAVSNIWLWIALGWPQVIVLFGVAWLKDRHRNKADPVSF